MAHNSNISEEKQVDDLKEFSMEELNAAFKGCDTLSPELVNIGRAIDEKVKKEFDSSKKEKMIVSKSKLTGYFSLLGVE